MELFCSKQHPRQEQLKKQDIPWYMPIHTHLCEGRKPRSTKKWRNKTANSKWLLFGAFSNYWHDKMSGIVTEDHLSFWQFSRARGKKNEILGCQSSHLENIIVRKEVQRCEPSSGCFFKTEENFQQSFSVEWRDKLVRTCQGQNS